MHDSSVDSGEPGDGWEGTRRKGPGGKGAYQGYQLAPLVDTHMTVAHKGKVCTVQVVSLTVNLVL
jgi:hypothetical protein